MGAIPMSEWSHNLRIAIIQALDGSDLGRGGRIMALEQCGAQLENRTLVEGALLISGHKASGFSTCNIQAGILK